MTEAEKQEFLKLLNDEGIASLEDLARKIIDDNADFSILMNSSAPRGRRIIPYKPTPPPSGT